MSKEPELSMPSMEADWAAEVEQSYRLPVPKETTKNGVRTRVEVTYNERGDKLQITSTFKVITKRVPKVVAARSLSSLVEQFEKWKKFGASREDPPGPQVSTTMPADDVKMQFIRNRAGELLLENLDSAGDAAKSLRERGGGGMHCRHCKMNDHFSVNCPYKDFLGVLEDDDANGPPPPSVAQVMDMAPAGVAKIGGGSTYVPPSLRGGPGVRPPVQTMDQRRDENTVRVTNLPEETTDQDLRELFSRCGKVNRIYLAKDKQTLRSKGFAFVTYERRDEAEKAILTISGHKYDYVILKVEWAKQST